MLGFAVVFKIIVSDILYSSGSEQPMFFLLGAVGKHTVMNEKLFPIDTCFDSTSFKIILIDKHKGVYLFLC